MIKKVLLHASAVLVLSGMAVSGVHAAAVDKVDDPESKVTICHRTNSVKNPYSKISVNADSADGNTENDNGQGDHSEHTGPVATSETVAQAIKDAKEDWGDIIPPHDEYAGLNWSAEGQAIYNNNCNYVTPGSGGGGTTTTTTTTTPTTTTPQVTTPKAPVVHAGGGAGAVTSVGSLVALGGSLLTLGYGLIRFQKRSTL